MSHCCVREPHTISNNSFGVPKDDQEKKKWKAALGISFKKWDRICSNHFKEADIISTQSSGEGYSKYTVSVYCIDLSKL